MQTQSTCYKGTTKITPVGILWHCTGANNPTLKRYVQPSDVRPKEDTYSKDEWIKILGKNQYNNDWNHIERQAGLNAWIGKLADGTVTSIQTMPWNFKPWGCGSGSKGSCNNGWIQFEICEDGLTDKTYFNNVYKEACELTAYLCKLYNIDPKGTHTYNGVKVPTILCHQDAYKLKVGSDHSDVYNWFKKHNKTMDNVRNDVASLMNVTPTPTTVSTYELYTDVPTYATAGDAKAKSNKKGTYKAGTYYIYNKYPDGIYGMLNISTDKTGNSAGSWINPTENVKPVVENVTVKTYQVVTSLNRYSTVTDAKNKTNVKGTYEAGTYYIYEKYPDGSNGMFNISTDKTGKSAGSWINPSENVKQEVKPPVVTTPEPDETPKVETTKKVYELNFPNKHNICEYRDMTVEDYEKNFTKVCETILKNNSKFDINIVKAFFNIAPIYGIDPIRAISQSILETGWFKYGGSAVTPDQHNYCGMGVTSNGVKGSSFDTIENGVRAQLQHLFAYGSKESLPSGETLVDPRFKYVTRGLAPTWEELAGRWCVPGYEGNDLEASMKAGTTYGQKIDKIYQEIVTLDVSQETIEKYFNKEVVVNPDEKESVVDNSGDNSDDNNEVKIDNAKVNVVLGLLEKVLNFFIKLFGIDKDE
jgi:3-methyladenine DNA glycosylase Mpg